MDGLLDKFKNVRFPNWMRSVKSEEKFRSEIHVANDNLKNSAPNNHVVGAATVSVNIDPAYLGQDYSYLLVKELQGDFIEPVKLKLPASTKRRLRKDKRKYALVRKWLKYAEKKVNEDLFVKLNSQI